jgi:hypothetical protein
MSLARMSRQCKTFARFYQSHLKRVLEYFLEDFLKVASGELNSFDRRFEFVFREMATSGLTRNSKDQGFLT